MHHLKERIDELASLMEEFRLAEAELEGDDWKVAFKRRSAKPPKSTDSTEAEEHDTVFIDQGPPPAPADAKPAGTPVNSPMTGIYYSSPSPTSPAFVKEGEAVTAGQVIGLIEAMKVFNEISSPTSGVVTKVVAENGALVQPGDPLLYIG